MHDVIVVGAGPAGSFAAYRCSSLGLDTLLLEKEKLPRAKACGGAAGADVVSYLGKEVMDVVEREGKGNHLFFDYKKMRVLDKPKLFFRRERFDFFITQLAESAGCKVEDGKRVVSVSVGEDGVRVRTKGESHSSKIVIGGDGAYSVVGNSVGLVHEKERQYAALRSQIDMPDSEIDSLLDIRDETHGNTYFFSDLLGFAWLIPNRDSINAGIGALVRKSINLKGKYKEFVNHFGLDEKVPTKGHLIPYRPLDRVYSERVCLVGDAGGFVNPWNGCGIDLGIESSEKAAEICKKAIEENDFSLVSMSRYQGLLETQIRTLRLRSNVVGLLDDITPSDFTMPTIGQTFVKHLSRLV